MASSNPQAPFTPPYTPYTPPEPPKDTDNDKPSTAAELVRLAGIIDALINANDFSFTTPEAQELVSHIAPDFISQIDCVRHPDEVLSWSELVEAWRKGSEDDPGVSFAWTSVSTNVDESKGVAQLFVEKQITAVGGMKFHVMEEQRWRREDAHDDKWLLHHILGMRGTPANSGFDQEDMKLSEPGMLEQLRARPYSDEAPAEAQRAQSVPIIRIEDTDEMEP